MLGNELWILLAAFMEPVPLLRYLMVRQEDEALPRPGQDRLSDLFWSIERPSPFRKWSCPLAVSRVPS
jgi:hypothetical protein